MNSLSPNRALLPLLLFCLPIAALAQLQVTLSHPDGHYAVGEQVVFQVTATAAGAATYSIGWDARSPSLVTGNLNLSAGQTVNLAHTADEQGFLLFNIAQGGNFASAGAAISPRSIVPLEPAPSDFADFWASQKAGLDAIPMDPQLELLTSAANSTTWKLSLASLDGRRIYGYISVPTGAGPFPAVVVLPAFGQGADVAVPETILAEFGGLIAVSMNLHNSPADEADPNAYLPDDISSKEGNYYRYGVLGALRILDYLHTRPDFDGEHIALSGVSQGGGLSLLAAGLDERVDLVTASNPALCEHVGLKYEKASGFPYYIERSRLTNGTAQHEAATIAAVKYYDAVHAASRFKGVAWLHIGYRDDVSPPATSMAAWNELRCQKILTHLPLIGHNHPSDYWDGRLDFFRRHFPVQPSIPNATTTGYAVDAGNDLTVNAGGSLNLSGSVMRNALALNGLTANWRLAQGPGSVNFSSPNSYATAASFTLPGEYWLEFSAIDPALLASDNKFYEVADYVRVTVSDPNPGNDPPTVTLGIQTLHSNGSVTVRVQFSEAVTGLEASDFVVTNGTAMLVTGSGTTWHVFIQPNGAGVPTVQLAHNTAFDSGNAGNLASNILELPFTPPPPGCDNVTAGGEIEGEQTECEAFLAEPIASLSAATGGTGNLLYQWQRSPELQNPVWTDIAGATEPSYSPGDISQTTWFRRTARREGCTGAGAVSNPIVKEVSSGNAFQMADPSAYCAANGLQPWWEWIARVDIGGTGFDSFKERYGDFNYHSFKAAPGESLPLALTPGFGTFITEVYWRVWADFNFDGDFSDAGELVFSRKSSGTVFGDFQVPATTPAGATRLRVAMRVGAYPSPCGQFLRGEVEDYTLLIADSAPPAYCAALGEQPWWEWIERVDVAGLQSNSLKEGYGDFTQRIAVFEKGEAHQLFVTAGRAAGMNDPVHFAGWLDFNADGDFEDPGEKLFAKTDETIAGDLLFIPTDASSGLTRMRLAVSRDAAPTPCGVTPLGEVEDYTVLITGCEDGNRLSALLDFHASPHEGQVETSWVTNTDFKNALFILERSADGTHFEAIGFSEPVTQGYFPNLYHATDAQPLPGTSHYRLRQVHQNGSFKLSAVRTVFFDFDPSGMQLFPNPNTGQRAHLRLPSAAGLPVKLLVVNQMGLTVRQIELAEMPDSVYSLELGGLPDGMYFVWALPEGRKAVAARLVVSRL